MPHAALTAVTVQCRQQMKPLLLQRHKCTMCHVVSVKRKDRGQRKAGAGGTKESLSLGASEVKAYAGDYLVKECSSQRDQKGQRACILGGRCAGVEREEGGRDETREVARDKVM